MEIYDKRKVGKFIAGLRDHAVYEYGENEVIKFSRLEYLMGTRMSHRIVRDLEICKKFFGEYQLETKIMCSPDLKHIVLIQPKISGEYLSKKHLEKRELKAQFEDILKRYQSLTARHAPIDLLGQGGVWKHCLSNIFVVDKKYLRIIDVTLLDTRGLGGWGVVFKPIATFALRLQKKRIEELVG